MIKTITITIPRKIPTSHRPRAEGTSARRPRATPTSRLTCRAMSRLCLALLLAAACSGPPHATLPVDPLIGAGASSAANLAADADAAPADTAQPPAAHAL